MPSGVTMPMPLMNTLRIGGHEFRLHRFTLL
jgi:hypothetical protein